MDILIAIIGLLILNTLIGAALCAYLDEKVSGEFEEWIDRDPTGGFMAFFVLNLWPVSLFLYWKNRVENNTD